MSKHSEERWTILLVNLVTGETMEVDPDALRSRGMPDGYELADSISTERWIDALKAALS